MSVLALHIYQPFASYRNPYTWRYTQTYPLPPKTTIVGMIQNLLGPEYYYNTELFNRLKIFVAGDHNALFTNYIHHIKAQKISFKNGTIYVTQEKSVRGKRRRVTVPLRESQFTPLKLSELFQVYLWIFIKGNKETIDAINESIENLRIIPALGRWEDVAVIRWKELLDDGSGKNTKVTKAIKEFPDLFDEFESIPFEAPLGFYVPSPSKRKHKGISIKLPIFVDYFPDNKDVERSLINIDKNKSRKVEFGRFDFISPGERFEVSKDDDLIILNDPTLRHNIEIFNKKIILPVRWY